MTAIGIYLLSHHRLDLSVWLWVIIFFAPDLSMFGYLIDSKVGAISCNLFHHKGIAIGVAFSGYYFKKELLISIGILLFAHASLDRVWGYGLKYQDSFKQTHIGSLEKVKS